MSQLFVLKGSNGTRLSYNGESVQAGKDDVVSKNECFLLEGGEVKPFSAAGDFKATFCGEDMACANVTVNEKPVLAIPEAGCMCGVDWSQLKEVTVALKANAATEKYLQCRSADHDASVFLLDVQGEEVGDMQKFKLVKQDDGSYGLKCGNGFFCCVTPDGQVEINRNEVGGAWEKLQIDWSDLNSVSIKTSHGKYFQACGDGSLAVDKAESAGAGESFKLELCDLETFSTFQLTEVAVALKANAATEKYLQCRSTDHDASVFLLDVQGEEVGDMQKFKLVKQDDGKWGLKCGNGFFCCVRPDGLVELNRNEVGGDWEKFEIDLTDLSSVSVKTSHGKYFQACGDGSLAVDKAENAGAGESFTLEFLCSE